jgi:hypothetical protein
VRRSIVIVAALGTTLGALLGGTLAAFSAVTSNSGNTFSAAASFCSNPGTQTVTASLDSWIDEAVPSSNFGTDTRLQVQTKSAGNQRALVTFVLPAGSGCSVTNATLRLFLETSEGVRTLEAYRLASSWTESGVTWSNQPGTTGTAATASSTTTPNTWIEWTVTSQVAAMYSGSNNGFLVKDATEGAASRVRQKFTSREGTNQPQLVVTLG